MVAGQAERLVEISAKASPDFVRLAWHIGNRHTDVQIVDKTFRIRRDHVLEEMVAPRCKLTALEAPFDPEPARRMAAIITMTDDPGASALYRLMAWLSPAYPVGAFSYSSGIEWAVEAATSRMPKPEALADRDDRRRRRASAMRCSSCTRIGRSKQTTIRRCARSPNLPPRSRRRRSAISKRPRRAAPSSRRRARPGRARRWSGLPRAWDGPVAYPVAVGVASAGHGVAVEPALDAFLHAVTANLISAGVRLVPLGQTDGQRVLAAFEPIVAATAARALATPLDQVGGAAFRADLASMLHETQYTRLFRS